MITLPDCPPIRDGAPRYVYFGLDQVPVLGGSQSRISRLGDRWAIDVETYSARYADIGKAYLAKLIAGLREPVSLAFPEPGLERRSYGAAPVVNLPGASGMALPVGGLTPGVLVQDGKFLSVKIAGQGYLYQVTADVVAKIDGTAVLPIQPMLRVQPPVGASVEIEKPRIDGFIQGNQQDWAVSHSKFLPFRFSIQESD